MGATILTLIMLPLLLDVHSLILFILFVHSPFVVVKISLTTYCKTCFTLTKFDTLKILLLQQEYSTFSRKVITISAYLHLHILNDYYSTVTSLLGDSQDLQSLIRFQTLIFCFQEMYHDDIQRSTGPVIHIHSLEDPRNMLSQFHIPFS